MSPMKRHSTVQDVIDSHSGVAPGFGFLRHALAVVIILYHTYNITFGRDANPGYAKGELIANWSDLGATQFAIEVLRPGLFALVGAFFALSGFLVAGSALRTKSVRVFLSFRVLRILPALLTEVTLSALVLGPIVTVHSLSQYFSGSEFYHYFGNILGIVRYTLPGVFVDNPRANFVNANLWTLPAEFYCYLVLAALMGVGVFLQSRLYNWALLLGTVALLALPPLFGLSPRADNTHYSVYYIVYLFFVGALFYLYAHIIPVRFGMFAISAWATTSSPSWAASICLLASCWSIASSISAGANFRLSTRPYAGTIIRTECISMAIRSRRRSSFSCSRCSSGGLGSSVSRP